MISHFFTEYWIAGDGVNDGLGSNRGLLGLVKDDICECLDYHHLLSGRCCEKGVNHRLNNVDICLGKEIKRTDSSIMYS